MNARFILPAFAALMLTATPVLAEDKPAGKAKYADKSIVEMWDRKDGEGKRYKGGERRADWQAEKEKIKALSPEERAAYMEKKQAERKARMQERIEKMPPEKQAEARAKMEEFEARRAAVKQELMALPPEEREARMKELQNDMKAKYGAAHEDRFQKRWDNASADDRAAFCERAATECGGDDKPRLCAKATEICGQ